MSSFHVYIANSPESARHNVERFAAASGLSAAAAVLLEDCIAHAWEDGHMRTSVAGNAMAAALQELQERELIDIAQLSDGDIVVLPTVLASMEGAAAGVGWNRRIGVFDWPGIGSDAAPDG
ncbi:MAG TPA: hypothetical protein VKT51_06645 [Candidatus Eremiobacteraceae bacterium]|nr:hypothetical protein [Candidatus Eremiobacteraceae bacterium]